MSADNSAQLPQTLIFVRDEAAVVDAFGAHTRLGKTIADLILSNDSIKTVGIMGPWGSGKSTVVRVVEDILRKSATEPKVSFFTYDAWIHQSDPPRRAFLETLVDHLVKEGILQGSEWQTKLDELDGRIVDTDTAILPNLTVGARVLLLSLYFVPVGIPLLGFSSVDNLLNRTTQDPTGRAAFWAGLVLVLAPLFVALGIAVKRTRFKPEDSKGKWFQKKPEFANESLFSIFNSKTVQRQRSRVTRTPEPTTIEFQRFFKDVLHAIAAHKRRLVIVIDNLDRLHGHEAVSMWTTIRSFMLGSNQAHDLTSLLPVTLLPLDPRAIADMLGGEDNAPAAKSFCEKTFDLSFHVPPPVRTDWKAYVETRMKLVFTPAVPAAWIYEVQQILALSPAARNELTPRQINSMINAIGILWLQRKDDGIPFSSIAYYGVVGADAIPLMLSGQLRADVDILANDSDWQRSVAALHFGVEPEKAFQVLLRGPIQEAISSLNIEKIQELSASPGFIEVLNTILDSNTNLPIAQFVIYSAACISDLQPQLGSQLTTAWRHIRNLMATCTNWDNLSALGGIAFANMLRFTGNAGLRESLPALARRLNEFPATIFTVPEQVTVFVDMAFALLNAADKAALPTPSLRVNGDAGAHLAVCAEAAKRMPLSLSFENPYQPQDIALELLRSLQQPLPHEEFQQRFCVALQLKMNSDWASLIDASRHVIASPSAPYDAVTNSLFVLNKLSGESTVCASVAEELVRDTSVSQRLMEMGDSAERGIVLALNLIFTYGGATPSSRDWESTLGAQPNLTSAIEKLESEFGLVIKTQNILRAARDDRSFLPVARLLLSHRALSSRLGPLPLAELISAHEILPALLAEESQNVAMNSMFNDDAFWHALMGAHLTNELAELLIILISGRIQLAADIESKITDLGVSKLSALSAQGWLTALKERNGVFYLAIEIEAKRARPLDALGGPLLRALSKMLPTPDKALSWPALTSWFQATYLINENDQTKLFKRLTAALPSDQPDTIVKIVLAGGDTFLANGGLADDPDQGLLRIVLPLCRTDNGLAVLDNHASIFCDWLALAQPEIVAEVFLALQDLKKHASDHHRTTLNNITSQWQSVISGRTKPKP